MAERESLKDMQARLAERLKLARSSGVSVAWLAVTAGGGNYLLPLRQPGELLPISQWQVVPHTKQWFLGVMNIRGSLFGTIDLGQFIAYALGNGQSTLDGSAPFSANAIDAPSSVVTINPAIEASCALQVSMLAGLRSEDAFAYSIPADPRGPTFLGPQYFDAQGERWQEINLQTLSQSPQFLNISA